MPSKAIAPGSRLGRPSWRKFLCLFRRLGGKRGKGKRGQPLGRRNHADGRTWEVPCRPSREPTWAQADVELGERGIRDSERREME